MPGKTNRPIPYSRTSSPTKQADLAPLRYFRGMSLSPADDLFRYCGPLAYDHNSNAQQHRLCTYQGEYPSTTPEIPGTIFQKIAYRPVPDIVRLRIHLVSAFSVSLPEQHSLSGHQHPIRLPVFEKPMLVVANIAHGRKHRESGVFAGPRKSLGCSGCEI